MALLFDSVLSELIAVFVVSCAAVYWYFNNAFKYWESRGIPSVPPSFPFGHLGPVLSGKQSLGLVLQHHYDVLGKISKFTGFFSFSTPSLIVSDPEEIKNIFVRDFKYFTDRDFYYNEKDDPISAHLFALGGQQWKNLRTKVTPTFTSGKLKFMFPTILERAEELNLFLKDAVTKDPNIEMKDVFARFTTDIIGTCAFGIECNSLKDPDAAFRKTGQFIFTRTISDTIKQLFCSSYPDLARKLGVKIIKPVVNDFFMKVVKDTIKYRENNNVRRNDFMDLLIQLKNKGTLEDDSSETKSNKSLTLTENEIVAQTLIFFVAGFETSSSVMSFCLYELAINTEVQERAREEINNILDKHDGKMSYEALLEMPYLDCVLHETMRKYPSVPQLSRVCVQDFKLPGPNITIKKGTVVQIPVRGLHHDSRYYPNPEKFDPERFTEENKANRHPFTYLPFGEGPRVCIGLRFGMMQTRLGIVTLLRNYRVKTTEKTIIPLQIDPKNFLTMTLGGIFLNITPLK